MKTYEKKKYISIVGNRGNGSLSPACQHNEVPRYLLHCSHHYVWPANPQIWLHFIVTFVSLWHAPFSHWEIVLLIFFLFIRAAEAVLEISVIVIKSSTELCNFFYVLLSFIKRVYPYTLIVMEICCCPILEFLGKPIFHAPASYLFFLTVSHLQVAI